MTDFMLGERPSKRPFFGSTNPSNFFDDDDEQYFAFSKAASDSGGYSMVGLTNPSSSIMPNGSHHALNDNKDVSVMDTSVGSGNSLSSNCNASMTTLDDVKLNAPINNNKGASANTDVTNVSCKAEPGSKETTELNKIGKSNSVKSPSTASSSQPTTTTPQQPPSTNNKKRTRATPEQLAILEDTFKTNTSPNSKVREALAEKVNMSERSIQIWFQNRRAKMKAMQKRAHLMINQDTIGHHFMACMPGYGHNLFPYRMPIHQRIALPRSYSANDLSPLNNVNALGMRSAPNSAGLGITVPQVPQGFWPSGPLTAPIPMTTSEHLMNGFPFSANPLVNAQPQTQSQRFPISPNASPNSNAMNSAQALRLVVNPNNGIPIKMNASVISCETLTIGSWRRILTMSSPTDLLCYYTLPQNIFTYHITNENTQFKMEFPLSDIFSVEFRPIDEVHSQIAIEVKSPPSFFMEAPHGGWNMCKDFTEDRQATRNRRHVLKGRSVVMKPQLIKLMQVDQNLAKVVTILDIPAPADPLSPDMAEDDIMMNNNGQQNPPRRSSFPVSGPIANHIQYSDPQKGNIKHEMNLLNQMVRVQRRSASAPISPSEENRNSSLGIPMSQQNLQIDTSTNFLEMFKADSSPEFCSSPMELNSSPSTPLDVFDNSPALMDSSPLLNQDPFVSLPSHNLSNLTLDSVTSTLLSDEQVAAAMVTFAPPMNSHDLQNVSNEDFANMFMSSGSDTASDGSEFLNFNDNIHGNDNYGSNTMNLDTSAWVGDVAYC
ncbi:17210_t:CDS:2 [Funneliformis geosporum]|uniref:17210_t:CDS:1 n=1 Tax=Funneliformis geosporum TaxID=1117311 RepID=A0A9W4SRI6_9GLOM|nr:17210_t:CDS:2 [Funneliformis geosporum]